MPDLLPVLRQGMGRRRAGASHAAHVVVGKSDGTAHGDHLIEAHVQPTLELVLTEAPKPLQRRLNAEIGLALIPL